MTKKVLILVGTKKGAFIIEGNTGRSSWRLRGPFCSGGRLITLSLIPPRPRSMPGAVTNGSARPSGSPSIWAQTGLLLAVPGRLELPTFGLGNRCSVHIGQN